MTIAEQILSKYKHWLPHIDGVVVDFDGLETEAEETGIASVVDGKKRYKFEDGSVIVCGHVTAEAC